MTEQQFEMQINRLNSQWPRTYGGERKALLWSGLHAVDGDDFKAAVDTLLLRMRAAPMFEDLDKACNEAKSRRYQGGPRGGGGFYETLQEAEAKEGGADPDFVRACMTHLSRFLGKIKVVRSRIYVDPIERGSFLEGCDALDDVASKLNPKGRRSSHVGVRRPDHRLNQTGEVVRGNE